MTHFVVIYALIMSWYPRIIPSYPIGDIMLDHVVEAVKEDHETPCLMKKPMKTWNP